MLFFTILQFGIFIAWVLSLREVGKFPRCGIYAAILKKVFWHCLKMMVFYFPLLVAFALCLRILVPGVSFHFEHPTLQHVCVLIFAHYVFYFYDQKGQYTYLFFAIVKVVIMMTGEAELL